MEKIFATILALIFAMSCVLALEGCRNKSGDKSCDHVWSDASCLMPKTCNVCGKKKGEALGHTTDKGTCSRCGEKFGWKLGVYVDEFKNPTGEQYIFTESFGTFSNTYEKDARLYVVMKVGIEKETGQYVEFQLYEYCDSIVTAYTTKDYNVIMLDTEGKKHNLTCKMYEDTNYIWMPPDKYALGIVSSSHSVIDALNKDGMVSFYFEDANNYLCNYLFSIETGNFSILYSQIESNNLYKIN